MADKKQLQQNVLKKIEEVNPFCRDDFKNLATVLSQYREQNQQREKMYQAWITAFFQKAMEKSACGYCGTTIKSPPAGSQEFFCSPPCQEAWKINVMIVLGAFM